MANSFLAHTTKIALHEVSTLLKKKVVEIDDVVNLSEFSGRQGRRLQIDKCLRNNAVK